MTRIFETVSAGPGDIYEITGENANHISRSLRMREGERIIICDGAGNDYHCTLTGFSKESVWARIDRIENNPAEPGYRAVLYMSLVKSDKMDFIIQKAVETGASEITPVLTDRCVSKPDKEQLRSKLGRWRKIAFSAASQCGRGIIPRINDCIRFDEAVALMKKSDLSFICYEDEKKDGLYSLLKNREYPPCPEISFMVGCEGGFSENEIVRAKEAGIRPVSLGRRILRAETAPIFVFSCLTMLLDG